MGEKDKKDKNGRILDLYTRLLNGERILKSEAAVEYKVSEKSIQRDMHVIRNFLDLKSTESGYMNELICDEGYRLDKIPSKLTNSEILAVCKILLDSRAFVKEEMDELLDKLLDCCVPKKNVKIVSDLISNEKYHYVQLQHGKHFMDKLWDIGQAIRECRVIEITYTRRKDKVCVKRRLQPMAIMFSEYYFYLTAFIENINKNEQFDIANDPFPTIYRIDRIETLKVTEEHFKYPYNNRFEEGEFRKRIQFMYGGKLQKTEFWYKGDAIEAVLDRLPTAQVIKEEDGKYLVRAETFGTGIEMWLRSQGDVVETIE